MLFILFMICISYGQFLIEIMPWLWFLATSTLPALFSPRLGIILCSSRSGCNRMPFHWNCTDKRCHLQVLLSRELNILIATGALVTPSSLYFLLKVSFFANLFYGPSCCTILDGHILNYCTCHFSLKGFWLVSA